MNETTLRQTSVNPNKALWAKGDFTRISETMHESGEALIKNLNIHKGLDILDLGCGDGTTAVPAARLGANVTGVDITRYLVEAGNRRAKSEGLDNCVFKEGDAMNLQEFKDESFDMVISIFGAMFAPKPFDVANEMVRVSRRKGWIIMGNWIPGDPTLVAQILKISSAYTPAPPEGFISPMLWGIESHVVERFGKAGVPPENISCVKDTFTFHASYSPKQFLEHFRNYYAPTMTAFEAAEKNGKASEMQHELEELFIKENRSGDPNTTSIPATFLRVTVMR